jgi:putative transposase
MATPNRHGRIPGTYFVTSRTWESRALFVTEPFCTRFLQTLFEYREKSVYALHAFVLMPDHFHVLLTPAGDVTLERTVQFIKGGSARKLAIEHRMQFPVWQCGFSDHRVRDAVDYAGHIRYVEQNPVRKRLVTKPTDYLWSSASGRYNLDPVPQGLKPMGRATSVGTAKAVP